MAQAATTKMSREEADALRKQAASLRQQIIDSALKSPELGDVEPISQFRSRHQELQDQAAVSQKQLKRLEKAKTLFAPVEQDAQEKQQARDQLIASLQEIHRPLGKAAFEGHLAGNLSELPVLADRLELHQRIEALRQEYDAQAPVADAGIVDSTKAKALQLATAGKIKLEEMKVGKAETQLGQKLIESKEETSVSCDQTQEVLSKLAQLRIDISEREQEYEAAHSDKEAKATKLAEALGMASVTSCRDLDAEASRCKQTIQQNGTDAQGAQSQLVTLLLSDGSQIPQGGSLAESLGQLRSIETQLEQAPSSFHLDKKVWYGIGGAAVLLMMMCCVLGAIGAFLEPSTDIQTTDSTESGTANAKIADDSDSTKRPSLADGPVDYATLVNQISYLKMRGKKGGIDPGATPLGFLSDTNLRLSLGTMEPYGAGPIMVLIAHTSDDNVVLVQLHSGWDLKNDKAKSMGAMGAVINTVCNDILPNESGAVRKFVQENNTNIILGGATETFGKATVTVKLLKSEYIFRVALYTDGNET